MKKHILYIILGLLFSSTAYSQNEIKIEDLFTLGEKLKSEEKFKQAINTFRLIEGSDEATPIQQERAKDKREQCVLDLQNAFIELQKKNKELTLKVKALDKLEKYIYIQVDSLKKYRDKAGVIAESECLMESRGSLKRLITTKEKIRLTTNLEPSFFIPFKVEIERIGYEVTNKKIKNVTVFYIKGSFSKDKAECILEKIKSIEINGEHLEPISEPNKEP